MNGEDGRRIEHLRLLYARQKREGESFDAFVARARAEGLAPRELEDTSPDDRCGAPGDDTPPG